MKLDNAVEGSASPWYMLPIEQQLEKIENAPSDIRESVRSLAMDGVAVLHRALDPALCDELVAQIKDLVARNNGVFEPLRSPEGHLPRIVNLQSVLPGLSRLFSSNTHARELLRYMFQADPCLYTALFFQRGSMQPIHRDTPVFATRPEYYYFGVWVALEDADEQNGSLNVIRKGHLLPERDRMTLALKRFEKLEDVPSLSNDLWDDYQREVTEECVMNSLEIELVTAKKGDTIVWHPQLPHGGSPIKDLTRTRNSFVMHCTPVGVPVRHIDAFCNPAEYGSKADYEYMQVEDGGWIVAHGGTDVDHKVFLRPDELK